jgi:agmatine deiminase
LVPPPHAACSDRQRRGLRHSRRGRRRATAFAGVDDDDRQREATGAGPLTRRLASTPADDGFRMPGEFEPHRGTWMLWPERPDTWRHGGKPAQRAYVDVATAIARSEPVSMGVSPGQWQHARDMLPPDVRVVEITSNDAWARDCGPTFVVDDHGDRRAVDWEFNAWGGLDGGLYVPWDQDDLVAAKIADLEGVDRYRAPIVLEGGSIHVDGEGTLVTTEQCLLNPNRNPRHTRNSLERVLRDHLGLERIVWLGEGVHNDETSGHVDNLACFARPGVVLLTWTGNRSDPQHAVSLDARRRLDAATDAKGRSFEVHLLPSPGPLYTVADETADIDAAPGTIPRTTGNRLAGSYVNAYLTNGSVIVPLLDPAHDDEALAVYADAFPDREVVGVAAREILLGGGNIHCITQQVPEPVRAA